MEQQKLITIDIGRVLADRLGERRMRLLPRFVVGWLERFICQERLNRLLRDNYPSTGADFCRGVLADLGVSYDVENAYRLPDPSNPDDCRVLFVSNHPLGGLDGMILIDMLARRCTPPGMKLKFIVNDLLSAVTPLADVFVPVNKHGRQSRGVVSAVDDAFGAPGPVVMFPAGLCSRRDSSGRVRDLAWNQMFVRRAIKSGRDVIPLRFDGKNSSFFYNFARCRAKLGIKFNIEMIRLPGEMINSQDKKFSVTVGPRILWPELENPYGAAAEAARIRDLVYNL